MFVPLRTRVDASGAASWYLDLDEFARAFSERTRVVILNTPHNPTGKVRPRLAALCWVRSPCCVMHDADARCSHSRSWKASLPL